MPAHINADGEFQSDKYPTCPPGKVPLSVKDPTAQDLLWEYAQRRRVVDAEFSADLEDALKKAGYTPPPPMPRCTCGANTVGAGMFGPPPHREDCELSQRASFTVTMFGPPPHREDCELSQRASFTVTK